MSLKCKFFLSESEKTDLKGTWTRRVDLFFYAIPNFSFKNTLEIENSLPQLICINHSSWQHLFWASAPSDKYYYSSSKGKILVLTVWVVFFLLESEYSVFLLTFGKYGSIPLKITNVFQLAQVPVDHPWDTLLIYIVVRQIQIIKAKNRIVQCQVLVKTES